MQKITFIIIAILLIAFGVFFSIETWESLQLHWTLITRWINNHHRTFYPWFIWISFGAVCFPLMDKYWEKNIQMTKTFTHELIHTITSLLLFRRIHSFQAEEKGSGVIYSSGSVGTHLLVALAPYCFPIYTIPLLLIRCIVLKPMLPIIDVIIGFTLGLHGTCIKSQIGNYQTDINQFPYWFSYLYIIVVWIFMLSLILISYEPQMNIILTFRDYGVDLWQMLLSVIK